MALRLITTQEFRTSRYADVADQVDDIETIIEQAENHIETKLDRRLKAETYTEVYRPTSNRLYTRERPIISLTSVSTRSTHTDDWVLLDLSDFEVEPAGAKGVILDMAEVIKGEQIQLVYVAGYTEIPSAIKSAVILVTVMLAFQDLEVFGAGDGREPAITHLQRQADRLLTPFVKARLL
jgi:hypothetical protein